MKKVQIYSEEPLSSGENHFELDMLGQFKNSTLQEEFIYYCLKQKSPYYFVIIGFMIISWSFAEAIASLIYHKGSAAEYTFDAISFFLVFVAIITGTQLFVFASRKRESLFHSYVQVIFIFSLNFLLYVKISKQIEQGTLACIPADIVKMQESQQRQSETSSHGLLLTLPICPSSTSYISLLSFDMKVVMSAAPLLMTVILYEPRLYVIEICNLIMATLILYSIKASYFNFLPGGIAFIILSMIFYDLHRQRIQSFLTNIKLREILNERERNADAIHAMEMRHMIGNVAHDLKTPLASFTTAVDMIKDIISSTQEKFSSSVLDPTITGFLDESFGNIYQTITGIQNTNAFMLMTINRCIDYTKASKGMKLVPKYETIDLNETIQFPIQCMLGLQEKINISFAPLSKEICSHIITDKQWLQENLLCLLSNAVKYSAEGVVDLRVFLTDFKPISTGAHVQYKPQLSQMKLAEVASVDFEDHEIATKEKLQLDPHHHAQVELAASTSDKEHQKDYVPLHVQSCGSNEQDQRYLRFEIEDNGIGISEEAMKTLFTPFKQAQRLAGGTGLGLFSLAKRIEAINGSYGVSKRKDMKKGTLFWFVIPYRPDDVSSNMLTKLKLSAPGGALDNPDLKQSVSVTSSPVNATKLRSGGGGVMNSDVNPATSISITFRSTTSNNPSQKTEKQNQSDQNQHQNLISNQNIHILIVDDALSILKMMGMMLKRQGYTISTAENGAIALQKLEEKWKTTGKGFDLILMDLQMPVMDGLEATRRIREMEKEGIDWMKSSSTVLTNDESLSNSLSTPLAIKKQLIFGVSANSDNETMKDAFDAGIDDFIGKPFSIDIFHARFQRFSNQLL